jgi:hypothetical protein
MAHRNTGALEPSCCLAHALINRMSVVIGSCDLVINRLEKLAVEDAECIRRMQAIREAAELAVQDLTGQLCPLATGKPAAGTTRARQDHRDERC